MSIDTVWPLTDLTSLFNNQLNQPNFSKPIVSRVNNLGKRANIENWDRDGDVRHTARAAKRQKFTFPKIEQEYLGEGENGDYLVRKFFKHPTNGAIYELQPLHFNMTQHQVWKATTGKQIYILKTYHHLEGQSARSRINIILNADKDGKVKIQQFLTQHNIEGFRIANHYSNPVNDGFLLMEYVDGELNYTKAWKDQNVSFADLDVTSQTILQRARQLIEKMWEQKVDLGDFRPDNVIWKDNLLVFVDYTCESDQNDFGKHIRHYVKEWAQKNPAIEDYLYQNLQDLKNARFDSFLESI